MPDVPTVRCVVDVADVVAMRVARDHDVDKHMPRKCALAKKQSHVVRRHRQLVSRRFDVCLHHAKRQ